MGPEPGARLSGLAALSATVLSSGPWVLQRLYERQRLGSSSLAFFLSMSSKRAPRFHVYTCTAPDPDPDLRVGQARTEALCRQAHGPLLRAYCVYGVAAPQPP